MKSTFQVLLTIGMLTLISVDSKSQMECKTYRIAKIKVDSSQLEKYKSALKDQMNAAMNFEPGVLSYTAIADKKIPCRLQF